MHTPGPWHLEEIADSQGGVTHCVKAGDDSFVTYGLPNTAALPELMANAELLAAAPELFRAVDDLLVIVEALNTGEASDDMMGRFEAIRETFNERKD